MCKHIHLVCRFIIKNLTTNNDNIQIFNSNEEALSNLEIHLPENTSAMDESKVLVQALSKRKQNSSSEARKQQLIKDFTELVGNAKTSEDLDIIEIAITSVKTKFNAVRVLEGKKQEFIQKTHRSIKQKIPPQRRLFSTKKQRKSAKNVISNCNSQSQDIA